MICTGNSSEYCGGPSLLNVYDYNMEYNYTSSSSTSGPVGVAPTGSSVPSATPTQPATVGAYNWYGCQTEATNERALSSSTFAANSMTLDDCAQFCAGYTYFGAEYSRECYCGDSFNAGSVAAPASDCDMACEGDADEYCGAGNRLSVYVLANPASGSGTGGSTATASSSPPTETGFPTGWTYQGCWIDGANGRILSYQAPDSQTLTQQSCAATCLGMNYTISGTEYASQCFCGDTIVNGGSQTVESACNTACTGDSSEMCGGGDRLTIYSDGTPTVDLLPAPQTGGLNGSWTYEGCYEDNVNQARTFFWQIFYDGIMTPNMCLSQCAAFGYMAAGLEYGQECYCGDPANIQTVGSTQQPDTSCNIPCAGNASAICGGENLLSTYFWTGTPFYTWTFPQEPAQAGSYTFLIGGETVPLITMQSITGKVTFLSKWGTGPANETGAYELDLTEIDNWDLAWRTLHVKTDIFCSAGIILPDKVGRQLTVGGWSGESTDGLRLYWPDGSAGVPGTNDWQENVEELSLQIGRWYPSAMIMANGSIMVIGGEVGSNAAAVPSIEILPYTGTAPLYMDWLDRTNPNNLYPYCFVLPSGGIFVAYWNEARILDEVTFNTTKTLPNMPGSVSDATGGRTYPLEGAAALMPLRAPYEDPVEFLVCGGSDDGPGNAIDNCVSTMPEVDNPTWVIERLPAFRVMPCIAPLPDGTYLIANGAVHGVAGFGLASDPNLNALLYDPTQAYGSRITIMANTTVARLYHSEAITLLDGRVLISGSDPQDGVNPEEYRLEVFSPPYLLNGKTRPTFTLDNTDWAWNQTGIPFTLGGPPVNGDITVTLLGAVGSTHGNSMGARTLFPAMTCSGTSCTVDAPPNAHVSPPGWYQFFVLDGGIPAVGVYVRIGGDPAELGNWPDFPDFTIPGV